MIHRKLQNVVYMKKKIDVKKKEKEKRKGGTSRKKGGHHRVLSTRTCDPTLKDGFLFCLNKIRNYSSDGFVSYFSFFISGFNVDIFIFSYFRQVLHISTQVMNYNLVSVVKA